MYTASYSLIRKIYFYYFQSKFVFNDNKLTSGNGQGQVFFAESIGSCVLPQLAVENNTVFESSIYAVPKIFDFT